MKYIFPENQQIMLILAKSQFLPKYMMYDTYHNIPTNIVIGAESINPCIRRLFIIIIIIAENIVPLA